MFYRIPIKTVTNQKKITIALVFIYVTITALLMMDNASNNIEPRKSDYITHNYQQVSRDGNDNIRLLSNNTYSVIQ